MRLSILKAALLGGAVGLAALPAFAQTKVTNQGVTATEIVIGTHQDLSGPIKVWGVPVLNGMQLAVDDVNAKGGINGRKLRLVAEDTQYDPKKDVLFDAGVPQLFPLTAAEFTYKFDPAKPQERLKFNNLLPYVESTRAALKYMVEWKKPKAACIMYQDDEYGKNVFDGFTLQLEAMKMKAASVTTYKRGASDFSAQAAKLKADGCDLVVLGTVIRETIGLMAESKKIGFAPTWLGATPVNVLEIPALGKELVEGLYAAAGFVIPYRDTSTGAVKAWCEAYFKKFNTEPNSQAVIGYNTVMTFAHYAQVAGKELTGQKFLDALESGSVYQDIFASPPTKFSKTNHLATTITQVQEVKNGRWVLVKGDLLF